MSRGFLRAAVIGSMAVFFTFLPSTVFPGNFVAFGPQSYTRSTGTPVVVTNAFTVLNPSTSYTLQIYNGGLTDGEFEKVSSSVISLNGVQVVGPNEFNQNVGLIEKPVTLTGSNQLSVELRGKPGGGITVQIIGVDNDPPGVSIASPSNGAAVTISPITVTGTVTDAISGVASILCNNSAASLSQATFSCDVALLDGPNTIVAQATDRAGNIRSSSITVNLVRGPSITISSPTDGSVVERPTILVLGQVSAPEGVQSVTVNGIAAQANDGAFGTIIPVELGANLITATVVDLVGDTTSDSITVIRQDPTDPDFLGMWNALKDSLRRGDIDTALNLIVVKSRERYRGIFTVLGSQLSEIDLILTDISPVAIRQEDAKFEMFRSGRSFEILFVRDDDGIWRLASF